jgi:hypothetical protein
LLIEHNMELSTRSCSCARGRVLARNIPEQITGDPVRTELYFGV